MPRRRRHYGLPFVWLAISTAALQAHVVSISTGEIRVTGRAATYELHMPWYEIEKLPSPETALLKELTFRNGHLKSSACSREADDYVCKANYEFDVDLPDKLEVACTLFRATVPNHVHMLYAVQGSDGDQVVFDQNTTQREIRFHPPTLTETVVRDGTAGAKQLLKSVSGLLFLVAILLAARGGLEGTILVALFLISEWLVRPLSPWIPVGMSAQFLEAVMALTVAYLAAETVFLPEGRARWMIVPILGLAHGLPFAAFPAFYLVGAISVQALLLAAFGALLWKLPETWRRPLAGGLLLVAAGWFARLLMA